MYRQKRQQEEMNKPDNADNSNNQQTSYPVLSGNANNRILKRYSYNSSGDCSNKGGKFKENLSYQKWRQENTSDLERQPFQRRYDSKHDWNQTRYKNKDSGSPYTICTPDQIATRQNYGSNGVSLVKLPMERFVYNYPVLDENIRTKSHTSLSRDNRLASISERDGSMSRDSDIHENKAVQFYKGASAYFSTNNISEPVYL